MGCILALILQVAEVKRELQGSQAKVEQQERELGGAHQKLRGLEEEFSRLQQESAALSQQKAEVDRLQGRHAEHAHIYRQDSLPMSLPREEPIRVHSKAAHQCIVVLVTHSTAHSSPILPWLAAVTHLAFPRTGTRVPDI